MSPSARGVQDQKEHECGCMMSTLAIIITCSLRARARLINLKTRTAFTGKPSAARAYIYIYALQFLPCAPISQYIFRGLEKELGIERSNIDPEHMKLYEA